MERLGIDNHNEIITKEILALIPLRWNSTKDVNLLTDYVLRKHIFIGSTDTVLGLMGMVDPQIKQSLDQIKARSGKAYIILVDSIDKVERLCDIPHDKIKRFLTLCWPGPVTVILPVKSEHLGLVGSATAALRIPNHKGLQQLLAKLPYGLYSTSANISGDQVACALEQVTETIKQSCCYYIDNGMQQQQLASTIVDCSQGNVNIIRTGLYPVEMLQRLYDSA